MGIFNKDKSNLSIPKSKKVCGYEIKKMPIGKYLKALDKLESLPDDFIGRCFPGLTLQQVLNELTTADENTIKTILSKLFFTTPEYIVAFISELTEIPEDALLNDEKIGALGLVDIANAFIEVNELGKFIAEAKGLLKKMKTITKVTKTTENTGFRG